MELVLATHKLSDSGGAQTYALTVAEHLARLGHAVTLYAQEVGATAEMARERALRVTANVEELPRRADGVITGVHRGLALQLAARYPGATRVFVVHGSEDVHLPPPVPGAVAATIVLNDLHAARAAACTGAGEVVRLRQPVDLRRFSERGSPRTHPERVLLLGHYHRSHSGRGEILRAAWADANLRWEEVGGARERLDVPTAIAETDVVVGYGRSVLEAMACGRPVYVHDHSGSEGWLTPQTYERLEAGGFAVAAVRKPPDAAQLRADLDAYRPEWGQAGRDLARAHHDARDHAAAVVSLLQRLGPGQRCAGRSKLRALELLAESQLRAELLAEHFRVESKQWFALYQGLQEQRASDHGAWELSRAELERDRQHYAQAADLAEQRLTRFRSTKRYRLAQALARPLDRVRAGRTSR